MRRGRSVARRPSRRGQALVELMLIVPILALLFMGVSTTSAFLSDAQIAGQAVKAGARLAAEDGNAGYVSTNTPAGCQTTAKDPCEVDQEVVETVVSVIGNLTNFSGISEIDIYEPCVVTSGSCASGSGLCTYARSGFNGSWQAGQPEDVYKLQGGVWTRQNTSGLYTLDLRDQTQPSETSIGVRVVYTFQAAAPMTFFNFQTSQYATTCLAPALEGV